MGTMTVNLATTLQKAFDFYNQNLFFGKLTQSVILLQRKNTNIYGYFIANGFETKNEQFSVSEIALNPTVFASRDTKDILSTLVHEMCHQWQAEFGLKYKKNKYHNKEWADKMESLGLMPSHTGSKGGKRTGTNMTHYIIENGLFTLKTDELLATGFNFDMVAIPLTVKNKVSVKLKYECAKCGLKVWGKPDLRILCETCNNLLGTEV